MKCFVSGLVGHDVQSVRSEVENGVVPSAEPSAQVRQNKNMIARPSREGGQQVARS